VYKKSQEGDSFAVNVCFGNKMEELPSHKRKPLIYEFTCLGRNRPLSSDFFRKCTNDDGLHINYNANIKHALLNQCSLFLFYTSTRVTRGSIVGWGTLLQAGRSWVPFPMKSMDFPIDLILPAEL
jgi:hypothetical protein